MHPFFEQNNLLLLFKASAIGLFFRLLFMLLVSRSLFNVDIDDPPSSAMLACGFAAILPLFLRGYDVVLSTRCCFTFFLCGVFHLQQMPQSLNTRTMVSTIHNYC
jgi:hypothetical protein